MTPLQWYENKLAELKEQAGFRRKRKSRLGTARLLSFLLMIILFYVFLQINLLIAILLGVIGLIAFLHFVLADSNNQQMLNRLERLININEEEIKALRYDFLPFDEGDIYKEEGHPYAADLDIFGSHSLFRMVNRCNQEPAKALLAKWLKQPSEKEVILHRQQAVKELKDKPEWRQELSASAGGQIITSSMWQSLSAWLKTKYDVHNERTLTIFCRFLPFLSFAFILWVILSSKSYSLLWLPLILHIIIMYLAGKQAEVVFGQLEYSSEAIASFGSAITIIEKETFTEDHLINLQQQCQHKNEKASVILKKWQKILGRIDLRNNKLVGTTLNLLIFWDWWQFRALRKWKEAYHQVVKNWMGVLAEMEASSSLANLSFNYPEWIFPEIINEYFVFEAEKLGHPLIPEGKRVDNSVSLNGTGKLMLVTGSNMAGKSTFLRTAGINIVLALAGAPVCAGSMKISPVTVYSSMRIADKLEENISTFYAELKKLEVIINQVNKQERIFVLLDEILRGTNSHDRHTGSKAMIRQLLREKAVGMIATHDLELSQMEAEYPGSLMNYHFDVQVKGEELFFDYQLKKGVCQSMNASILMKKIGLKVEN